MRSAWDQSGRAGDDAQYWVRLRECSVGLTVTVCCHWSRVIKGGVVVPSHWWDELGYEQRKDLCMSFFRKPPVVTGGKGGGADPVDDKMRKNYPTLWSYLSESAWPDGEVRKRSSLVVFCEDSMVKACLSDRELEVSLWAASGSFLGVLEALEGRLTEDQPEWRAAKKKRA
jgi:hypothetical protein